MIHAETSTSFFKCINSDCDNEFKANIVKHKGGVNDYGWWAIECKKCSEIFSNYIGRDVNDSNLASGGKILKRYDKEFYSEDEVIDDITSLKNEEK